MKGFLVVLTALLLFPAPLFCVSLENGFLKVDVDDDVGRIFLTSASSTESSEDAGRRALLFYDRPPTSFTAVTLASGTAVFGSTEGRFTVRPRLEHGEIVCEWEVDMVRTTQTVAFVERRSSGRPDGVLIRYVMRNLGEREIPAGVCVVFDTVLSEKSPAHFQLSDGRSVGSPLELGGSGMPRFWSTDGGGACLMGVLRGSSASTPDRALFANYRYIREHLVPSPLEPQPPRKAGFSYGEFSRDDSAVALVFTPAPLAGEREYRVVVGLCGEEEFGPAEAVPDMSAPLSRTKTAAGVPEGVPEKVGERLSPAAPEEKTRPSEKTAGNQPSSGGGTAASGGDPFGSIDKLVEDIDALLEELGSPPEYGSGVKPGSSGAKGTPKMPGDEEIKKLNERLKEIESEKGEGK